MSLKLMAQLAQCERQIKEIEARLIERDNVLDGINKALAEIKAKRIGRPPKDKNGLGTTQSDD